jgi:hypothetical protein
MQQSKPMIALLVVLSLASCTHTVWKKPGSTAADFNHDLKECEDKERTAEASAAGSRGTNTPNLMYVKFSCLKQRGWTP